MTVILHIWAKPGRPAVHIHQADQVRLYQGIEAIVNRSHGNFRNLSLNSNKDFFSSGMIPVLEQNVIDVLAMRSEPEPAMSQAFVELAIGR